LSRTTVWEDDHSGAPQVYVAVKRHSDESTSRIDQLSDSEEAFEPTIAAIGNDRWVAAWEQDGTVAARVINADGLGPMSALAGKGSRQVMLASDHSGRIAALWAREQQAGQLIEAAELRIEQRAAVLIAPAAPVAGVTDHPFQGYPAAA
jgi:hypothetical protein